jgi:myo-inositol-1(or 4)-monophosphatase
MSAELYLRELEVARALASQAGELIASRWGSALKVEHKGAVDLVTEVDLAAERLIVSGLTAAFPEDTLCGEEGSAGLAVDEESAAAAHVMRAEGRAGGGGRVWYIDPLDGTTNFSHGLPHFCVSIALVVGGEPAVGVIYEPLRRWCFYARRGGGAWRDGVALRASAQGELRRALLATGFPYDRHTSDDDNTTEARALLKRAQGLRRAGAAALDLAFVAAGWLDGYWERKLKPWDAAAGALIVREAGGALTDDLGGDAWLRRGAVVTAGNAELHAQLLSAFLEARGRREVSV